MIAEEVVKRSKELIMDEQDIWSYNNLNRDIKNEITHERSLIILEEILNKYDETLFENKNKKEYKSFVLGISAIQSAWKKAFDNDRLQIVASIDLEEYIDKD